MSVYAVPAPDRFWRRVVKTDTCWLYNGRGDDYGRFYPTQGQPVPAHRFAYEMFVGPVPEGLELDHLCMAKGCVRPGHLEPVTRSENVHRASEPHRWRRAVEARAMSESALLTAREVAERLNVSRQTIWRWGQDGTLPRVTIAGTVRFRAEDVEALAKGAA